MKKLIFISGKYRDVDKEKTADNVYLAEVYGSGLLAHGYIPIIPMTTFPHFESIPFLSKLTDTDWMKIYIEPLILQCFALFTLPNWEKSILAPKEVAYAKVIGIPIVTTLEELQALNK
jgi:hypothetical protein